MSTKNGQKLIQEISHNFDESATPSSTVKARYSERSVPSNFFYYNEYSQNGRFLYSEFYMNEKKIFL